MFDAYTTRAKQRRVPIVAVVLVLAAAIAAVVYAKRTTEPPAPAVSPDPFGAGGSADLPMPEMHRVRLPGMSLEMLFDPSIEGTDAQGTASWFVGGDSAYVVKWFEEAEPSPGELDGKMRAWLTVAMQDAGVPLRILGSRQLRVGDRMRHALDYDSGDPRQPGRGSFTTVPCGKRLVYLIATNIDDRGVELVWSSFRCELSGA